MSALNAAARLLEQLDAEALRGLNGRSLLLTQ